MQATSKSRKFKLSVMTLHKIFHTPVSMIRISQVSIGRKWSVMNGSPHGDKPAVEMWLGATSLYRYFISRIERDVSLHQRPITRTALNVSAYVRPRCSVRFYLLSLFCACLSRSPLYLPASGLRGGSLLVLILNLGLRVWTVLPTFRR